MKVAVFVKATPSSEAGQMPTQQLMEEMGQYNLALLNAGIMQSGEGLKPSSRGVRVRFCGSDRLVVKGPFAETNELVAGFWMWDVASLEDAVEWVKKCPNPMLEDSEIEIRPLMESEDFGEAFTQELQKQENQMRGELALRQATVHSYLFFNGRCEEAMEFYRNAAGARIGMVLRFSESPEPAPEGMVPPGWENKIMHCDFTIGQTMVMASDGCAESPHFDGFRLALTVPTQADANRVFHALAEGGTVDMPLGKTFWSPRYGQVTDKFGVGWMVMVPGKHL
jgi:PhnB protein